MSPDSFSPFRTTFGRVAAPLTARRFAPVFVPSPFGVAAATAATGAMAAAGVSSRVIRGAFSTEVASLALSSFIPSS